MSKNITACLSHNHDNWKTPKCLYDPLMKLGYIDTFKYLANYDEFENNYYGKKLFINPPFSKMKKVCEWIKKQIENGNEIILLIPSRTDTKYFHDLLATKTPYIYFIEGRLHYNEANSAPFPSMILYWDTRVYNILQIPIYSKGTIEKFLKMKGYEH